MRKFEIDMEWAESFLQTGNHDEYRAALQELTVMLRILQNIDRPLLQNIL